MLNQKIFEWSRFEEFKWKAYKTQHGNDSLESVDQVWQYSKKHVDSSPALFSPQQRQHMQSLTSFLAADSLTSSFPGLIGIHFACSQNAGVHRRNKPFLWRGRQVTSKNEESSTDLLIESTTIDPTKWYASRTFQKGKHTNAYQLKYTKGS